MRRELTVVAALASLAGTAWLAYGCGTTCVASEACRESGECTDLGDGIRCAANSDADCRASARCKKKGLCSLIPNGCGAKSEADCAKSTDCKDLNLCHLDANQHDCVRVPIWTPCQHPADCASGLCIPYGVTPTDPNPQPFTCVDVCPDKCSAGATCILLSGIADPQCYWNAGLWPRLCQTCDKDADCNDAAAHGLCLVAAGAVGGHCGAECESEISCPEGYACQLAIGTASQGKQCVSASPCK